MLWRRFCPSHYMNDHIAGTPFSGIPLDVRLSRIVTTQGSLLFLPVFFSSFRIRSRFSWFFPPMHRLFPQSSFLSFIYFFVKFIFLSNIIFLYCKINVWVRIKKGGNRTCISLCVDQSIFSHLLYILSLIHLLYFLLLLYSVALVRYLRMTLLFSVLFPVNI